MPVTFCSLSNEQEISHHPTHLLGHVATQVDLLLHQFRWGLEHPDVVCSVASVLGFGRLLWIPLLGLEVRHSPGQQPVGVHHLLAGLDGGVCQEGVRDSIYIYWVLGLAIVSSIQ